MSLVAPAAKRIAAICLGLFAGAAFAQSDGPRFPTTEFAEGAKSAAVTVGDVTAGVSMVSRPDIDAEFDVPLLSVMVGDRRVLEAAGVSSGFDTPAAEASIAEMDPANVRPEVYFSSYSGGLHCCSSILVATQAGEKWTAVDFGEFDGDGYFLNDVDHDGLAEIVVPDNRFLYEFDCYACSAAPLRILTVRRGKAVDVSTEIQYLPAHRDWLRQIEAAVDPGERWTSRGFLAGWVAAKVRVGQGAAAFEDLTMHWDFAKDEGEEVCLTGADIEDCPKRQRAVLKFPDRLKLFLERTGYPVS